MQQEIRTISERALGGLGVYVKRIFLICCGALLMAVNIKTFVRAGNLFPGGFTGLALLIQRVAEQYFSLKIPYSPIVILLNSVPVVISFKYIGRRFTLYSCLMIVLSSVLTDILPGFNITQDVLLASVFGGLLSSVAVYLCLLAGATSGGTDFIAIFISEKFGKDAWNYILIFNAAILCAAGIMFGWNRALYSILFQFTSTQMLNTVYKRYQKVTMFVITDKAADVYKAIHDTTNHDATLFTGTGCYGNTRRDMLYSVVSGDDVRAVTKKIKETDPHAFINIVHSQQILGKFYVRPND
ncbi:MAG TPA: hypothetical protein DCL73_08030 [Treponema sp.]|nr:hypothetical protein [Treponema sp.]